MIRLFRVFIPRSILALVLLDFLLIFGCFVFGYSVALGFPVYDLNIFLLDENAWLTALIPTITIMLVMYIQDLYANVRFRSVMALFGPIGQAVGLALCTQALILYVYRGLAMSKGAVFYGSLAVIILLPLWRIAFINVINRGFGIDRVLFLGCGAVGIEVAEQLFEMPELGFMPIGFMDDETPAGTMIGRTSVLGPIDQLRTVADKLRPDLIIVNLPERRSRMPVDTLLDMRFSGVRIMDTLTAYELTYGRISIRLLRPSHLIFSTELGPRRWSLRLQTVYSFVLAVIGLILTAPIMLLTAIAVRLTSPGPILFRQQRVGLDGEPFTLYKFRSMVVNAEAATGAVWATKNDPRVTKIGRFLRNTRLDELPQLFNVLSGKMSLVGPRPERPEFVRTLSETIPFYRQRHCVKPGVTGWAQVKFKYGETIEDTITKLEYDLYYIKHLSPSLDMFIIFHTVKVMLFTSHGQ